MKISEKKRIGSDFSKEGLFDESPEKSITDRLNEIDQEESARLDAVIRRYKRHFNL